MSQLARRMLDSAAETRLRAVDAWCPAKRDGGEHNSITVTHWFRRLDVCASCGYVGRPR